METPKSESSTVECSQDVSTEETSPDSSFDDTGASTSNIEDSRNEKSTNHTSSVGESTVSVLSDSESSIKRTKFSGIPKLDSKDWHQNNCFKRYWDHHKYVTDWYKKHCHVYRSLQNKMTPKYSTSVQPYHAMHYPYHYPHPHPQPFHRHSAPSVHQPKKKGKKRHRSLKSQNQTESPSKRKPNDVGMEVESNVEYGEETMSCEGETSETKFDMDISDEMLDFFAKTQKHRKEREAEKKAEKAAEKKAEKRVNIEDVAGQQKLRTSDAPKERPGSRRTSEMKLLYGKGAAMIHGMETALQMTYDRNFDAKQPKYWPNMPLRIVFADG